MKPLDLGPSVDLAAKAHDIAERHRPRHPLEPDDCDEDSGVLDLEALRAKGATDLYLQRWAGRIPNRFIWAQLDKVAEQHPSVIADLTAWSEDPAGRNLVMLGPVGTGKSYAAVAACRPACSAGLGVQFLPVDELLDLLRPGGPEGALYDLADIDRLIVDDIGAERETDWTADRLFALINRRWLEELPTIVTSNLEPAALEQRVGPRLFSRLVGNDALVLRLSGSDRRRS